MDSGLKVANPDTGSGILPTASMQQAISLGGRLDFDPQKSHAAAPPRRQTSTSLAAAAAATAAGHRYSKRQSIPPTYQAQQQAQFPQYPTMIPASSRSPGTSTRPMSAILGSYSGPGDLDRSSLKTGLRRSSSRSAAVALQAGVPVSEDASDDSYRGRDRKQQNIESPPSSGMESNTQPQTVQKPSDSTGHSKVRKGVKDFEFGRTLGEGSYSTVLAATDRESGRAYAIKVLDKRHIIKEKKVKYVNIEKDTLNRLTDHPGVVRLYYTFQDEQSLYFVLDLASSGELLAVLKKTTTFDEGCTRFYGAQILDTIEYIHARGVIHRDLKPENVLLDAKMHVKITDFGTAKMLSKGSQKGVLPLAAAAANTADADKASSFVGTAEYVSPELLTDKRACKGSDLWAFGCIIYQLLAGRPPFKAANEYLTFQKIVALDYSFPDGFPSLARDLVERLLVLDPNSRLALAHIKNHDFFAGIQWGRDLWKRDPPVLKAYVPSIKRGSPQATPGPKITTDLPPPTQLDIDWSPLLTKSNERVLQLSNFLVSASTIPANEIGKTWTPELVETPRKFSRFFSGNNAKKRARLVILTSAARMLIVAAGGEEKKPKAELDLMTPGCILQSMESGWSISLHDKYYAFTTAAEAKIDASEAWLTTIKALQSRSVTVASLQSSQDPSQVEAQPTRVKLQTTLRTDKSTNGQTKGLQVSTENAGHGEAISNDGFLAASRKRFSRRHSKSGLTAAF